MPRITVGVDAGGTSTVVAVAHDGVVVRTHRGSAGNASGRGPEAAARAIAETIFAALDGSMPQAIFVGAAGAGTTSVASQIEEALRSRFVGARVGVGDDAAIALRATMPQGDGAVLIAGTGSIAYAERGEAAFRAGGYGFLFGDAGSGFAIGSAAIKVALRALERREGRDGLAEAVARTLMADCVPDLLSAVYRSGDPPATVASLAPVVIESANSGERNAQKIVQTAALDLAELATSVLRSSGLAQASAPLVLAGGLLSGNSLLSFLLETRLQNDLPKVPIHKAAAEPWTGALRAAERLSR